MSAITAISAKAPVPNFSTFDHVAEGIVSSLYLASDEGCRVFPEAFSARSIGVERVQDRQSAQALSKHLHKSKAIGQAEPRLQDGAVAENNGSPNPRAIDGRVGVSVRFDCTLDLVRAYLDRAS
ncbi:MAG: hypothetical protein ACREIP_04240 [Alphaproteobacteria bacterium]